MIVTIEPDIALVLAIITLALFAYIAGKKMK